MSFLPCFAGDYFVGTYSDCKMSVKLLALPSPRIKCPSGIILACFVSFALPFRSLPCDKCLENGIVKKNLRINVVYVVSGLNCKQNYRYFIRRNHQREIISKC